MKRQFLIFVVRWVLNSFALWVAVRLLSTGDFADSSAAGFSTFLFAGAVLSFVNTLIKPIVIIFSLPFILLTLGLFMLFVNGLMIYITLALVPSIEVSFIGAVLTGIIVSLANYLLSGILELRNERKGV